MTEQTKQELEKIKLKTAKLVLENEKQKLAKNVDVKFEGQEKKTNIYEQSAPEAEASIKAIASVRATLDHMLGQMESTRHKFGELREAKRGVEEAEADLRRGQEAEFASREAALVAKEATSSVKTAEVKAPSRVVYPHTACRYPNLYLTSESHTVSNAQSSHSPLLEERKGKEQPEEDPQPTQQKASGLHTVSNGSAHRLPGLALRGNKPTWREREAAKKAKKS